MMEIQGTVTSISDVGNHTYITVEAADIEVRFRFEKDHIIGNKLETLRANRQMVSIVIDAAKVRQ